MRNFTLIVKLGITHFARVCVTKKDITTKSYPGFITLYLVLHTKRSSAACANTPFFSVSTGLDYLGKAKVIKH